MENLSDNMKEYNLRIGEVLKKRMKQIQQMKKEI
jgi:hypothetical protein